jgi:tRNA nucleotidyltransferase (CCA-adding enzyme)
MCEARWEHFPHEGDLGVRGFGNTKAEAFEQAALALTAVVTDLKHVEAKEVVNISCAAPDDELLFIDWLNALAYEMATRNMLFSRFEVHIEALLEALQLYGKAWGEVVDVLRYQPTVDVTYTVLRVAQDENNGWLVQCVVDV